MKKRHEQQNEFNWDQPEPYALVREDCREEQAPKCFIDRPAPYWQTCTGKRQFKCPYCEIYVNKLVHCHWEDATICQECADYWTPPEDSERARVYRETGKDTF